MALDGLLFFIFGYFLPFYPLTAWKIKIFKKLKKAPKGIIILQMWTKNYDQKVYRSEGLVRDGRKDGKSDMQRWVH